MFAAALLVMAACSDDSPSADSIAATTTPAPETTESAPATTDAVVTSVAPDTTVSPGGYDFAEATAIVEEFVDDRDLNGAGLVIVDRDDGIVGEIYVGEFDAERVSLIASSSKMLAAGVLLRLQDQGLLDLDAPVGSYLPWGDGNPDITVAQMLSNSSGLVGLFPDPGFTPYVCQFVGTEIEQCAQDVFATTDDDDDVVPPDTEFRYGGVQWQIAGAVAEAVSGKTWEELLHETYRQPCGVESLGFNNHWVTLGGGGFDYPEDFDVSALVPTENPHIEGGAYINPVDYATLLVMHLRDGQCDNGQVLSPEAVAQAHADRIGEVWNGAAGGETGYGLGWWVDRTSGRISDSGAYGSVPWLDVGNGLGAYLVIEADSGTGNELAALLYEPVEAAVLAGRGTPDY
jgi:CubicO group peptidase (beta-lactamase class C family)